MTNVTLPFHFSYASPLIALEADHAAVHLMNRLLEAFDDSESLSPRVLTALRHDAGLRNAARNPEEHLAIARVLYAEVVRRLEVPPSIHDGETLNLVMQVLGPLVLCMADDHAEHMTLPMDVASLSENVVRSVPQVIDRLTNAMHPGFQVTSSTMTTHVGENDHHDLVRLQLGALIHAVSINVHRFLRPAPMAHG